MSRLYTKRHRGQPSKGVMNKAEAQYAAYLSGCSAVVSWKFQAMKFQIAKGCWYEPDFLVELDSGLMKVVDVKVKWKSGTIGVTDDAMVKMKAVGQEFGIWFPCVMTWFDKKTSQWEEREFETLKANRGDGEQ